MSGYTINGRAVDNETFQTVLEYLNLASEWAKLPKLDPQETTAITPEVIYTRLDRNGDNCVNMNDLQMGLPSSNFGTVADILKRHGICAEPSSITPDNAHPADSEFLENLVRGKTLNLSRDDILPRLEGVLKKIAGGDQEILPHLSKYGLLKLLNYLISLRDRHKISDNQKKTPEDKIFERYGKPVADAVEKELFSRFIAADDGRTLIERSLQLFDGAEVIGIRTDFPDGHCNYSLNIKTPHGEYHNVPLDTNSWRVAFRKTGLPFVEINGERYLVPPVIVDAVMTFGHRVTSGNHLKVTSETETIQIPIQAQDFTDYVVAIMRAKDGVPVL